MSSDERIEHIGSDSKGFVAHALQRFVHTGALISFSVEHYDRTQTFDVVWIDGRSRNFRSLFEFQEFYDREIASKPLTDKPDFYDRIMLKKPEKPAISIRVGNSATLDFEKQSHPRRDANEQASALRARFIPQRPPIAEIAAAIQAAKDSPPADREQFVTDMNDLLKMFKLRLWVDGRQLLLRVEPGTDGQGKLQLFNKQTTRNLDATTFSIKPVDSSHDQRLKTFANRNP